LIQWVPGVIFDLGFVVVTIRSDKSTGQLGRKTYVVLGRERGGKERKYKYNVQPSIYGTRKCDCPFKLRDKRISNEDGWMLKVICGYHNHDLSQTLVGQLFAGRLKSYEHSLLVDMSKSQVKPANIQLTLKENN